MQLSQLEYFDALARERHFGRAAAVCSVTTSTMSEAVRKLEAEVGVPLVNRGRSSFQGLTAEGELLLGHARRLLDDHRRMMDDLTASAGRLETVLRLGVIPSGLAAAGAVLARLVQGNPGVRVDVTAGRGTGELLGRLHSHDLDAAVIHPLDDLPDDLVLTPLAPVRYGVALTGDLLRTLGEDAEGRGADDRTVLSLADLRRLPTGLLSTGMRARTLFDRAAQQAGTPVTPSAEADSTEALTALAATGQWAVVVPVDTPGAGGDLRILPLVDPVVEFPTALARPLTRPVSTLAAALDRAATAR